MANYVTSTTPNKNYVDDTRTYLNENAQLDNTRTHLNKDYDLGSYSIPDMVDKDLILLPCIKCGEHTRHISQSLPIYSKEACDMLDKTQEYFHKTTCTKCGYTSIRTEDYEFQCN